MADNEKRMRAFKNKGKDSDEMRRRRITQAVELRKAKKDEQLLKKRSIDVTNTNIELANGATSPQEMCSVTSSTTTMSAEEILMGMLSNEEDKQLKATEACRKILSRERNPPIDHIIRLGVVPRCVEFLTRHDSPNLQFEACWALTNIASGTSEQTQAVVAEGALPNLLALLNSPRSDVVEQAVWAIGNIAGDGAETRDTVLSTGAMPMLLRLIAPDSPISLLRNTVWAVSNLCRNKNPPPNFNLVKVALPTLAQLLYHTDKDVLADACWALSYLTDGSNEKIQAVVDTGLVPRLVQLLNCKEFEISVLTPALRAVGNIVTGNDSQTDLILNAGALPNIYNLLLHNRLNIVKEAAWTVSNMTAGNSGQIQKVLESGIMEPLLQVLATGDFKSQKEAAWAVTNFTSGGTVQQLAKLVEMGALKPMCNMLNSKEWKVVSVILDGLNNILSAATKMGEGERVAVMIEEAGGLDTLEALQTHDNEKVYEKALAIIENYYSDGVPEEVVNNVKDGQLNFNPEIERPNGGFNF